LSTDELSGHGTGVLPIGERLHASKERRDIAVRFLHQATPARRQVVDDLGRVEPQLAVINDVDISLRSGLNHAAIVKSKERRRLLCLEVNNLL
jgi:hypothetical protein